MPANRLLASLLFLGVSMRVGAVEAPLVPFPDGVNITVVSENLTVYGLPLMAYEYYTNKTQEEAATFYKNVWLAATDASDVDQAFLETKIGSWLVLSRLEIGHNITTQFADAGVKGTHVLIGVSPLPEFLLSERKNRIKINIPRLGDARVASVVASKDRGMVSEVYWVESNDGVDVFLSRYKIHFEETGANVQGYRVVDAGKDKASYGNLIVAAAEASYRFEAVRGEDKKTRAVVIWQPR